MKKHSFSTTILLGFTFFTVFCLQSINYCLANDYKLTQEVIKERIKAKRQRSEGISYKDFEHMYIGCPENSICNKQKADLLNSLNNSVKAVNLRSKGGLKKYLNIFKRYGIPFYYLTKKDNHKNNQSILWNSSCDLHNPEKGERIYKALDFAKHVSPKSISLSNGKKMNLDYTNVMDTIVDFTDKELKYYSAPYKERPLYFNGHQMIFQSSFEEIYFTLAVSPKSWKVTGLTSGVSKEVLLKKETIDCPKDLKLEVNKQFHRARYCQKIWDIKAKKYRLISIPWSCS